MNDINIINDYLNSKIADAVNQLYAFKYIIESYNTNLQNNIHSPQLLLFRGRKPSEFTYYHADYSNE